MGCETSDPKQNPNNLQQTLKRKNTMATLEQLIAQKAEIDAKQQEISAQVEKANAELLERNQAELKAKAAELVAQVLKLLDGTSEEITQYVAADLTKALAERFPKKKQAGRKVTGIKVAAKYRHGENEWTGRGLPPKWLVAELQAGRKKEDFLI
jgi:DNA-binding protein H-NS